MREDIEQGLRQAYPGGFLVAYIDAENQMRVTGHALDVHPWLTAFYHSALSLAAVLGADHAP